MISIDYKALYEAVRLQREKLADENAQLSAAVKVLSAELDARPDKAKKK